MHFKKTVQLFIFVFALVAINLNFAMDLNNILGEFCKQFFVAKHVDVNTEIFRRYFRKRNLDKCVAILLDSKKIAKENNIEGLNDCIFQEFRTSHEDDVFFKTINQKVEDIEKKKQPEHGKKNAKKKNKKVYSVDEYGRTELHNLVREGNLKGVQATLASCSAEYFNMRSKQKNIHVLHYAVDRAGLKDGFEIAKLLITYAANKGCDLNVTTLSGRTPLSIARDNGDTDLVDLLIKNGAE